MTTNPETTSLHDLLRKVLHETARKIKPGGVTTASPISVETYDEIIDALANAGKNDNFDPRC